MRLALAFFYLFTLAGAEQNHRLGGTGARPSALETLFDDVKVVTGTWESIDPDKTKWEWEGATCSEEGCFIVHKDFGKYRFPHSEAVEMPALKAKDIEEARSTPPKPESQKEILPIQEPSAGIPHMISGVKGIADKPVGAQVLVEWTMNPCYACDNLRPELKALAAEKKKQLGSDKFDLVEFKRGANAQQAGFWGIDGFPRLFLFKKTESGWEVMWDSSGGSKEAAARAIDLARQGKSSYTRPPPPRPGQRVVVKPPDWVLNQTVAVIPAEKPATDPGGSTRRSIHSSNGKVSWTRQDGTEAQIFLKPETDAEGKPTGVQIGVDFSGKRLPEPAQAAMVDYYSPYENKLDKAFHEKAYLVEGILKQRKPKGNITPASFTKEAPTQNPSAPQVANFKAKGAEPPGPETPHTGVPEKRRMPAAKITAGPDAELPEDKEDPHAFTTRGGSHNGALPEIIPRGGRSEKPEDVKPIIASRGPSSEPQKPAASTPKASVAKITPSKKLTPLEMMEISGGFYCAPRYGLYQPAHKDANRFLGRGPMSKAECEQVVFNARNNVICSKTLVDDGWKPTRFDGRGIRSANDGFFGSSMTYNDCLLAVYHSTPNAVCNWGGESFYANHPYTGHPARYRPRVRGPKESNADNKRRSLYECLDGTNPGWRNKNIAGKTHEPLPKPTEQAAWVTRDCMRECHSKPNFPKFPDWAMDAKTLEAALTHPDHAVEAKDLLQKLHYHLNVDQDMPPAGMDTGFHDDPQAQAFKASLAALAETHLPAKKTIEPPAASASRPGQLLPADWDRHYRGLMPKVSDKSVQAALQDTTTIYYDQAHLGSAYQDTEGIKGVRDGANPKFHPNSPINDPNNPGKPFVFAHGAGIDPKSSAKSFHSLSLPKKADGAVKPISYWFEKDPKNQEKVWKWTFPPGTLSTETIHNTDPAGNQHVIEVRTHKTTGTALDSFNEFRPFPTQKDLLTALAQIQKSHPKLATEAARVAVETRNAPLIPVEMGRGNFNVRLGKKGWTQKIPFMTPELVKVLLDRPFKSALGAVWVEKGGNKAFAATTDQAFGIVPQNSTHGALPVNSEDCQSCHRLSNTPFKNLYPGGKINAEYLAGRTFKNAQEREDARNVSLAVQNHLAAYGNTPGNGFNLRFTLFGGGRGRFEMEGVEDDRVLDPRLAPIVEFAGEKSFGPFQYIPYEQPEP